MNSTGAAAVRSTRKVRHSARVYESVMEMLPSPENPTPLVRINRLNPEPGLVLYAKLEWVNPFGSVKDRAAYYMLKELERTGAVSASHGMVEATSGNTGLALAAMAGAKGYATRVVVPEGVPREKKVLLKIAGAELEVVKDGPATRGRAAQDAAGARARTAPDQYVHPNQYENPQNVKAHMETTGPEIWRQTRGKITHLFVPLGTGGTATGAGRYLKQRNPALKVVAVQPSAGHDVPGVRNLSQMDICRLLDRRLIDELLEVDCELAYRRTLELCRKEGLLAGPSCGLVFEGARQTALRDKRGVGVMMFCDNIFKYTSIMINHMPELAAEDRRGTGGA